MKALFFSASALALSACAATGADEPRAEFRDREIRVVSSGGHHFIGDGSRVVEVIGEDGDRTVHVTSGDGTSVVTVDGRRIEITGDAVIVDGERHEFGGGRVVIEGDDVRITEGFGPHRAFAWHMGPDGEDIRAEVAIAMAEVERAMAGIDGIDWAERDEALAEAFAEIENMEIDIDEPDADTWVHRDGERVRFGDLSPEEQEEIREEIAEARVAAREALREARDEMRLARDEERRVRVEVRQAREEARRAGREARDALRWHFRDAGEGQEIRIERENGTTRVWRDGEELEGEELESFLDRMESGGRFAMVAPPDAPRVMVFRGEGEAPHVIRRGHVVIERDGERRVIEIERDGELEGGDAE